MDLQLISDAGFQLEGPYSFLTVRFYVDENNYQALFDVFSPKYDTHLKEETPRDVERLDIIMEEKRKWDHEKSVEDLWLVLD